MANSLVRALKALALIATWVSCTCFGTSTVHAATYSWTGATNTDFTNGGNWVEGSWEQWSDYNFGSSVTSGTATINGYFGIASLNLVSGLGQNIVINSSNPQPVIMGVNVAGNANALISIAADSRDLTINGEYISATPVTWDIGAGRTFTMNGPLNNWWANAGIVKNGAGTAVLSQASNYAAGTTINGGIVAATRGTLGSGNVVVNNGGVLLVNDQWVFSGVNPYGENPGSRASLTVNAGGEFRLDPISGFANGVVNLYLNGGSVTGGAGDDGRGALYLFEGNEQITAGGATTSTIASVLRLTGNNNSITVSDSSTLQITAAVANANWFGSPTPGGFVKSGNGTLVLTAGNGYTGQTDITAGTLKVGDGGTSGSLGSGAVAIASGATLVFDRGDNYATTSGQTFSGSGTLVKNGGGNLTFFPATVNQAVVSGLENLVVNSGTVRTDNWAQWNSNLNLTVNGSGVFEMWNTTTSIANLTGNGTVKNSANWSGYAPGQAYATNDLTIAAGNFSGTITDNGIGNGGNTGTDGDTRINLFKTGTGTLTLTGSNTFSGGVTINGGTLAANQNTLGTGGVVIDNGGALRVDNQWVFSGANGYNIAIVNPSSLTIKSGGALVFDATQGYANGITNLYLEGGSISGGDNGNGLGVMFLFNGNEQITARGGTTSTIASTIALTGSTNSITVEPASVLEITGRLIDNGAWGAGGFVKNGAGTLTLAGANTYTQATQVNAGTLAVNGSLGATAVSVASGATLAGSGSLAGAVNVLGTLSPGNSPGVITLGSLVLGGTSTTLIEIAGTARGSTYDGVDITTSGGLSYGGILSLDFSGLVSAVADGTTFDIFSFDGLASSGFSSVISTGLYSGTWNSQGGGSFELVSGGQTLTFSQATGDIIVVPEPGTLALAGLGLTAAAAVIRRRVRRCPGSVTA